MAGLLALAGAAGGQTLYYATSSAGLGSNTLQSVGTNGGSGALLFTASAAAQRCTAVAVDSLNSNLFLADGGDNELWKLTLSGGGLTAVATTPGYTTGLALDPVNKYIYYTTSSTVPASNTVGRIGYSGPGITQLFNAGAGAGVQRCTALAVDTVNSLIFVADAGLDALWSMNLSGGNVALVAANLGAAPLDLAVDPANQLLYFVTSSATSSSNTIQRVSYAGGTPTVLLSAGSVGGPGRCTSLDLDLANARIYFADASGSALWSLPLAGGTPANVLGGLAPGTVKKVRLFVPSSAGPNAHFSIASLLAVTPNLLAYWPFSPSTQANSFDNGYTGIFEGAAGIGPAGSGPALFNTPSNTAALLNGTNAYVTTSLSGGLTTNGPFADQGTILAWINLSALPSTAGHFFTIAAESQFGNDFDLQIETDNKIKFYTDAGSATVDPTPLTSANLNTWLFVAATFNSNVTRSVYLNGAVAATSVPGCAHIASEAATFSMGESLVFTGRYFDGALDDVAVFNRALSPAEIANLYSASLGLAFIPLNIQELGPNVTVSWTDPTALFKLQSATTVRGIYSNVPGATNPYVQSHAGAPEFFRLKSQ